MTETFMPNVGDVFVVGFAEDSPEVEVAVTCTWPEGSMPEGYPLPSSFDVVGEDLHLIVVPEDLGHRVWLWRRCGWYSECGNLLPTPWLAEDRPSGTVGHVPWRRRTESGELLCGDCTDRSQDIEQEAAEAEYAQHAHDDPREM